jgi:Fe2+ or Zn2+ uptake regulation protein
MNAQADLFNSRPAVERPYHQTTPLPAQTLREAVALAERQDDAVLALLQRIRRPLAPSAVHALGLEAGRSWLLTSVRRSMTNLERAGLLRKAGVVDGPHGKPEHTWGLA